MRAEVVPASLFQDHAVLQLEKFVPVWGTASPSESVTITFRGQKQSTVASPDGQWRVDLAPMKFTTEGADLTISGKNTVTVRDLVVGEVWLCSGQSNMEFPLSSSAGGGPEAAAANFPLLRQFKVKRAGSLRLESPTLPLSAMAGEQCPPISPIPQDCRLHLSGPS